MNALTKKYLRVTGWLWVTLIVFLAGGATAFVINMPQHASWRFGACKVFLEQYVRFPPTIKIEDGGETQGSAQISFSDRNPFGAEQIRVFECYFTQDNHLTRITMDRKALPVELVKTYDAQLPFLSSQKLDTALPKDPPRKLEDLKD